MFQRLKSKTKALSLRIRSRSVDSKVSGPAAETLSMASMPLIPQTESTAVLSDSGPGLFTTGDITKASAMAPPTKRSLNFAYSETPTTPPASVASAEQITVYDTAVQTTTTNQNIQESASAMGGATGIPLQTRRVSRHPNAIKCHEERQLCRVILPKQLAQGKQFQPQTPPVKQKEYQLYGFWQIRIFKTLPHN